MSWNPKVWMPSQSLQKRMVWYTFWLHVCVLCCGVHKVSNVRKCRFRHTQLYKGGKVGVNQHPQPVRRSKNNLKSWGLDASPNHYKKTKGLLVVLGTCMCFVWLGTHQITYTEMSVWGHPIFVFDGAMWYLVLSRLALRSTIGASSCSTNATYQNTPFAARESR